MSKYAILAQIVLTGGLAFIGQNLQKVFGARGNKGRSLPPMQLKCHVVPVKEPSIGTDC